MTFSADVHDDDILGFAVHDRARFVGAGEVPDPAGYFEMDEESSALLRLAGALGLPAAAAGWGYRYLDHDDSGYEGPPVTRL